MGKTKIFNEILDIKKGQRLTLTKHVNGNYAWMELYYGVSIMGGNYKTKTEARNDAINRIKALQMEFPDRKFELK